MPVLYRVCKTRRQGGPWHNIAVLFVLMPHWVVVLAGGYIMYLQGGSRADFTELAAHTLLAFLEPRNMYFVGIRY